MTAVLERPLVVSSPWRSNGFRWLLTGRTLNALGSAITPVAMALAVLHLGGSATELGLVVAAYALVDVVTTLFAGVLGDRFSRTLLMRGAAALACICQAVVAVSLTTGVATVPMLAALSAVNGALVAIAGPSSRAVVPQTVSVEALPAAVSVLRLSQNAAMVVGFSLGGVLVALFGPGWAIGVDALTFAVAAVCFTAMRVDRQQEPAEQQSMLRDMGAGAREVFRHTWLWLLIAQALIYHLMYGGIQGVLGPVRVTRLFGGAAWGLALAALMAGFIAGGIVSLRYRPRRMLLAGTAFLALTACFPLAMALPVPLPVILAGAFVHGFGLEVFSVNWDLAIQQNIAPDKLARVFAFDQVGSFVMRPLGLALTGPVAALTGERTWLAVTAAVMFVSAVMALLPASVRTLRRR
ncbi:MFS transporter [Dactylosporangium sp. CA-139066]|uniref:MFS transporter n=1 Tax=Dactylosporangium sp. CA-139066 TaxID=3239930 RepID=UPI003D94C04E